MLVGSTSKVVSFADGMVFLSQLYEYITKLTREYRAPSPPPLPLGDTDIVRRGFKPRISNEPAILSSAELLDIVGLKAWPQMFDVTGEAPSESTQISLLIRIF